MFPFHQGKAYIGSHCSAGEKQRRSPKQMVVAAARNVPQIPLSRPEKHRQQDHYHHPSTSPWPVTLPGQILWEPDVARVQPHVGHQNPVSKSGVQLFPVQKPIKRPGWWKGRLALFQRPAMRRGRLLSRLLAPHTGNQRARTFIDGGSGLRAKTAQSDLTVILKLVIGGLISIIRIV